MAQKLLKNVLSCKHWDKGYNSIKLKKDMKEKYKIDLIYPLKKNQKNIRLTDKEMSKFRLRRKNER